MLATLYFWKVSSYWMPFVAVGPVLNLVCLVIVSFLPESPRYLVNADRLDETRKAFAKIAKLNRKVLVQYNLNLKKTSKQKREKKQATESDSLDET